MSKQKTLQEKTDWFNKNIVAIPAGPVGNCSACMFRNTKSYCAKMDCGLLEADTIETFYWKPVNNYNVVAWPELYEFFSSTRVQDIMDISRGMMAKIKQEHSK